MFRILLILALFIFLWWTWPREETAPNVTPQPPQARVEPQPRTSKPPTQVTAPAPDPVRITPPNLTRSSPRALPKAEESAARERHAPPKGTVPFEQINGWVVAYGDILLGKPTQPDFPRSGFAPVSPVKLWDSATIPFSIHANLPNPERVLKVIAYFNQHTPLRFVPYQGEADNIVFVPEPGLCVSYLGRIGGNQPIYLDARCGETEIAHEILHAVAVIHEHSRADRDRFVSVNWANVDPDKQEQFMIVPSEWMGPLRDRPFDFNSVMLYPSDAFAVDRSKPTLISRGGQEIAPSRVGLSAEDLERLRVLYPR